MRTPLSLAAVLVVSYTCHAEPPNTEAGTSPIVEKRIPLDVRGSFVTPSNFPATDLPRARTGGHYEPLYLYYTPADMDLRFGYLVTPNRTRPTSHVPRAGSLDYRYRPADPRSQRSPVPRIGPPGGEPR